MPVQSGWRGKVGGRVPVPLHGPTPATILGLPGLSAVDEGKLRQGNRLAEWSARVIHEAGRVKVSVILENPVSSMLWLVPPVARELSKNTTVILDHCAYGAPSRERARGSHVGMVI